VQKGDTLWEIAKKYGVDFEQLKAMNTHLASPDMIMPGMKIKIPGVEKTVPKEMVQKKAEEIKHPYEDFVVSEQPVKKEKAKVKMEAPKEMVKKEEKMPMMEPIMPAMPAMPELPEMPLMQMPTMQQMPMMEQNQYTTIQFPEMKMMKKEKPTKKKKKVYEKKPSEYQAHHMLPFIPCIPVCHMPLHPHWHHEQQMPMCPKCMHHEHPIQVCPKCMHHDGFHHMKSHMHPPVHHSMGPMHYPAYHGMESHMDHYRHESNERPTHQVYDDFNKQDHGYSPPHFEMPFDAPQSPMFDDEKK